MRKLITGIAAAALAFPAAPAFAQYGGSPDQQVDEDDQQQDQISKDDADDADGVDVDDDYADGDPDYDADQDRELQQSEDGPIECRRSDGTTGLIVGGGAGALVGRGIDRRGERGTGTIIGAIAGALLGSAIERNSNAERCR